ncbi:MAG: CpsD/CapB family tyrosine-protein kinase [Micrococcales bacterium]|nr:CpsD/CapB family tyrosine-protein kinase [Micrococcales bacterium]
MTLREFWGLVLFSKWLLVALTFVGFGGGLFYAWWSVPTYSAQTVVRYTSPDELLKYGVTINPDPYVIQSTTVQNKIKAAMVDGRSLREVKADEGEAPNTVVITAYATSRTDVRTAANAAASEYIAELKRQYDDSVTIQQAQAAELLRSMPVDPGVDDPAASAEYDALMAQYRALSSQIAAAKVAPDPASVRTAAVKSTLSSIPSAVMVAVGALLGAFIGVAGAVVRNALDTKLHSTASVARIGETSLGVLSDVGRNARASEEDNERLPVAGRTANAFTQSIRELRTALQATMTYTDGSMLVVTSVEPGVPSGFITANLAASFALSGRRVIVVSGDLRQPTLNLLLMPDGRPRPDPSGTVPTRVPNLRQVLPLHTPLDPADYLATAQVRERLDDLRASADLLVMDAPPVLVAADAAIVSAYADATLLIAAEGTTRLNAVEEALTRLRAAGGRPLGVVVASDQVRGGYQAEYSYSSDAGHTTWSGPSLSSQYDSTATSSLPAQHLLP